MGLLCILTELQTADIFLSLFFGGIVSRVRTSKAINALSRGNKKEQLLHPDEVLED